MKKGKGQKRKLSLFEDIKKLAGRFTESQSTTAKITKLLLATIAMSGTLVIAVAAPNIFSAFPSTKRQRIPYTQKDRIRIQKGLHYLRGKGYITEEKTPSTTILSLTSKGKERLFDHLIEELNLRSKTHWDGKWRLIVFDIPEKKGITRDAFRAKLKQFGCLSLQKSVFLTPRACREEINLLRKALKIVPSVSYIETNHIENEPQWKKRFGLK